MNYFCLSFQYDKLRNQATSMKDKYEARISELEKLNESASKERDAALARVQEVQTKAKEAIKQAQEASSGGLGQEEVEAQVG